MGIFSGSDHGHSHGGGGGASHGHSHGGGGASHGHSHGKGAKDAAAKGHRRADSIDRDVWKEVVGDERSLTSFRRSAINTMLETSDGFNSIVCSNDHPISIISDRPSVHSGRSVQKPSRQNKDNTKREDTRIKIKDKRKYSSDSKEEQKAGFFLSSDDWKITLSFEFLFFFFCVST